MTDAEKRIAKMKYPKTLDDPRFGLSGDRQLAELVHHVISKSVMHPVDRRGNQVVRSFGEMLQLYATVPEADAPFPGLAAVQLTAAKQARNLLGVTFDDEHDAWNALVKEAFAGALPVWPVEPLCAYVPAPLWRVVERIILDGREVFVARMTAALDQNGTRKRKLSNHKRRDGGDGTIAPVSVNNPRARAAFLGKLLFELSANGRFADRLAEGSWNVRAVVGADLGSTQKRVVTRGASAASNGNVTDTAAPPLRLVRLAFAEYDTQVKQELDWEFGDDEVELINALPEKELTPQLERLLRDRLLVLWLPRFGQRAGAFPYLSEACVQFKHEFLDGQTGPGVLVFDPKTATSAVWRWRPFEDELVPFIKAYLAIKRRRPAHIIIAKTWKTVPADVETMELLDVPGGPASAQELLWAGGHPVVERSPALFRAQGFVPLSPDALTQRCTGHSARNNAVLVPRPGDGNRGFNPNAFRHMYRGLVSSPEALRYCERHGLDPERRDVWGEMGIDHKLDNLIARYKDDDSDLGRERGTRLGGRIVWEQLTTDLGLRTHRDSDTYRTALRAYDSNEEELRRIEADIARQAADVPINTVVSLMSRTRELGELKSTIVAIEAGHEDFLVTVADHIPNDEIPRVDLAQIKREHRQGVPQGRVRALKENHNYFGVEDLVEQGHGKPATVRGWMKNAMEGKHLPKNAPWKPDDNPVFQFAGDSRRRAVYADAVRLSTQEQRDIAARQRASEPREGWEHLPKMVPDPRPSARRRSLRAA